MKLENFPQAQKLVEKIAGITSILKDLNRPNIKVKLEDSVFSFLEIWHHHDTAEAKSAADFVGNLLAHYEAEKEKLLSELEKL